MNAPAASTWLRAGLASAAASVLLSGASGAAYLALSALALKQMSENAVGTLDRLTDAYYALDLVAVLLLIVFGIAVYHVTRGESRSARVLGRFVWIGTVGAGTAVAAATLLIAIVSAKFADALRHEQFLYQPPDAYIVSTIACAIAATVFFMGFALALSALMLPRPGMGRLLGLGGFVVVAIATVAYGWFITTLDLHPNPFEMVRPVRQVGALSAAAAGLLYCVWLFLTSVYLAVTFKPSPGAPGLPQPVPRVPVI